MQHPKMSKSYLDKGNFIVDTASRKFNVGGSKTREPRMMKISKLGYKTYDNSAADSHFKISNASSRDPINLDSSFAELAI